MDYLRQHFTFQSNLVAVSGSSFSYALPAMSVVTFVGLAANSASAPPTLTPVADQTMNAGQTLLVTNTATDPNVPPQTLTFTSFEQPIGRNVDAAGRDSCAIQLACAGKLGWHDQSGDGYGDGQWNTIERDQQFQCHCQSLKLPADSGFDCNIGRAGDIGVGRAARAGLHGFDYEESDRAPVHLAGADDDQFAGNAGDVDRTRYCRPCALLQHPDRAMILAGLVIRRRKA